MKVWELIEKLECLDKNKEVVIIHPSKDMGRTHLAIPVDTVEDIQIFWSNHHEDYIIPESNEEMGKSIVAIALK